MSLFVADIKIILRFKFRMYRAPFGCCEGATENAGVENAARAKMQGWKMRE